jgi:hypothetical protein
LVRRVHELNERVEDIQIEQNAQRVSLKEGERERKTS